tara:strand:+ start:763 stop:963 length:201 start_codon:yes stop_codon:yes gene_type:complete
MRTKKEVETHINALELIIIGLQEELDSIIAAEITQCNAETSERNARYEKKHTQEEEYRQMAIHIID